MSNKGPSVSLPPGAVPARHVGALVPAPFTAEVMSVHSRVVNLLLPEGFLVSLVRDPGDMTALAIEVPGLPNNGFDCRVFSRSGALVRSPPSTSGSKGELVIALGSGRTFSGGLLRGSLGDGLGATLRSAIPGLSGDDGFVSLLAEPRNQFARRAAEVLARGEGELPKLLGLGIGFTPSGDDFLTGYLMASDLWRASGRDAGVEEAAAARLRKSIDARLAETTAGGRTLLYLALRKSYPCYLLRFWRSIRLNNGGRLPANRVVTAVGRAADHGETSGLDALTGFAWFLLTRKGSVL